MNKLKIYENENEYIEFSAETAEILVCKQLLNPINTSFIHFIFDNFNKDWLRTDERKCLYQIAKKYWTSLDNVPSEETMREIFKNKKFQDNEKALLSEYETIVNFKEEDLDPKLVTETIKAYIKTKNIYFAILDNIQTLEQSGEIGDLLSKFEKIVQLDLSDDLGIEYFENFENHCKELLKKDEKMPFGFKFLDDNTYGGLPMHDTCLFIVMAKPGFGKSQFMMNIAANWVLNNKRVLMLSLEMSENMYSRRMDGIFSNLNINELHYNIDKLRSRIKGVKANIPNALLRIKEFPTGSLTPAMLKQYLKRLKQQKNFEPDIIFIDYLNIMKPNGNNAGALSLYEKCGRISEELRAISSEMKIPIMSAVQQNRSANGYAGENIDMSNVSESSGISATADAMVALFGLDGDKELGRKQIKILKNRFGKGVGMIESLKEDSNSLRMSDWTEDIDANDNVLGDVTVTSEPKSQKTQKPVNSQEPNVIEDL